MRNEPCSGSAGHRLDILFVREAASWQKPPFVRFAHYSGPAMLRYGVTIAVPVVALIVWIFLGPQKGWGAVPVVAMLGSLVWLAVLQIGATRGKLTNPDLGQLALSATKAMGTSNEFESWRAVGPQAGHLATELHRLNTGLAMLSVPDGVPGEQVERDWLAANVSPEFIGYLPNRTLTSTGDEPTAITVDDFAAGDPWPSLENRNRQWPVLGEADEPGSRQ